MLYNLIIQQHQRDLQEQKEAFEFSHAQESALLLKTKEQDMNQQHEHAMKQLHKKETETSNATLALTLASLKKELVHRWRFKTRAEAKAAIFEYIEAFLIISAGTHASDIKHHSRLFKI